MSELKQVCEELELDEEECGKLESKLGVLCRLVPKEKKKRKRSKWQECIASRRKGKPFDPHAMKALSVEYRAGKCPP
ncbi:hypothetical protein ES702_00460 [subsurface metagenome]